MPEELDLYYLMITDTKAEPIFYCYQVIESYEGID